MGSILSVFPILTSGIQRAQLRCAQLVLPGLVGGGGGGGEEMGMNWNIVDINWKSQYPTGESKV